MFKRLAISGAVLMLAASANAQVGPYNSAELIVKGRILPSPCGLSLAGGGLADYGDLPNALVKAWPVVGAGALARYEVPVAQAKTVPLTVNCDAPALFALSFNDNRITTVSPALPTRFGLGQYSPVGGAVVSIGSYFLGYQNLTVQTAIGTLFQQPTTRLINNPIPGSTPWTTAVGEQNLFISSGKSLAFSLQILGKVPQSLTAVRANLVVSVAPLQSVVNLALTPIEFNGSTTITLLGI